MASMIFWSGYGFGSHAGQSGYHGLRTTPQRSPATTRPNRYGRGWRRGQTERLARARAVLHLRECEYYSGVGRSAQPPAGRCNLLTPSGGTVDIFPSNSTKDVAGGQSEDRWQDCPSALATTQLSRRQKSTRDMHVCRAQLLTVQWSSLICIGPVLRRNVCAAADVSEHKSYTSYV